MSSPIICECGNNKPEDALAQTSGKVKLTKVQFITANYVCRDDVIDNKLTEEFIYALNDKGDFVHWALDKSLYKYKNKPKTKYNAKEEEKEKPKALSVVVHSKEKFKIKAWFKVEGELDNDPDIAIAFPFLSGYTFTECCKKGKRSGEFDLEFEVDNTPYENIITYQTNFCISFCYCDNKEWIPAGHSENELYITWRESKCKKEDFNSKYYIRESYLYLSCKQGYKSRKKDEDINLDEELKNIADSVFENLRALNTHRRRETFDEGMGYWRGRSGIKGEDFPDESSENILIYGEETCGGWADFFINLIQTQGFNSFEGKIKGFNIHTPAYFMRQIYGTVKNDVLQIESHYFKKEDTKNKISTQKEGDTYHIIRHGDDELSDVNNYVDYGEFIPCLFLIKNWNIKSHEVSKYPPEQGIPLKAQGNHNPVSVFWDHVFTIIKTAEGAYWYDPSYGIRSSQAFCDSKQLAAQYMQTSLSGILAAARPKDASKGSKMKENSSGLYIELFNDGFQPKHKVSAYIYKPIVNNMEEVTDYSYEEYPASCYNKYIVQIASLKSYNLEHKDFKRMHSDYGYQVKAKYINNWYKYYIEPFEDDTDAKEALAKAKTVFKDSFIQKNNN